MEHTFRFCQDSLTNRHAVVVNPRLVGRGGMAEIKSDKLNTPPGVCAALACYYVKFKRNGTPLEGLRSLKHLQSDNAEQEIEVLPGVKVYKLDGLLTKLQLPGQPETVIGQPLTRDMLGGLQSGNGLVFAFSTGNGGHACAAYRSRGFFGVGGHLSLFDPNYGEYQGGAAELVEFVLGAYPTVALKQKAVVR